MAIIQATNLTKKFGSFTAVGGVSFTIEQGEVVAILGANGAGKTTTMRMLTGYFEPNGGTAAVAGHDVVRERQAAQKAIGYLPEVPPLHPEMTVLGFLEFVARLRGTPASQARGRAALAMERSWLTDRANWVIGHLSRGYRQRVGIAQAIVADPAVLILDEPTAGLDPEQIQMVRSLISELARERTVLFSTHVLAEAEKVCHRAIILREGKVLADESIPTLLEIRGPTQEIALLVRGPRDPIVAALEAIPGVKQVSVTAVHALPADAGGRRGGTGDVQLRISAQKSPMLLHDLSRAVVQGGWAVDRIEYARNSLEDVYLKLAGAA